MQVTGPWPCCRLRYLQCRERTPNPAMPMRISSISHPPPFHDSAKKQCVIAIATKEEKIPAIPCAKASRHPAPYYSLPPSTATRRTRTRSPHVGVPRGYRAIRSSLRHRANTTHHGDSHSLPHSLLTPTCGHRTRPPRGIAWVPTERALCAVPSAPRLPNSTHRCRRPHQRRQIRALSARSSPRSGRRRPGYNEAPEEPMARDHSPAPNEYRPHCSRHRSDNGLDCNRRLRSTSGRHAPHIQLYASPPRAHEDSQASKRCHRLTTRPHCCRSAGNGLYSRDSSRPAATFYP